MRFRAVFLALLLVGVACAAPATAGAAGLDQNAVLFVHGIEGSGSQFESQRMRFESNGYPSAWIAEVDYDSTRAVGDKSEVHRQIDEAIAQLRERTGREKVDVIAHSLGTSVMHDYLAEGPMAEQRKATVGRYVNVDGQSENPGVPTLAVWAGRGAPGRSMDGAENVTIPNQTHVQTTTSAQSFVEFFKFLTGSPPAHDIVPQTGPIEIAGKALDFPRNAGLAGATVEVWEVDADGRRATKAPVHSITIGDTGEWGPVTVEAGRRYEFALVRTGVDAHHLYYEPFVRSDHAIRLLESDAIGEYAGNRPGSLGVVIIRYKELWGDQGAESDQLLINGTNVCNDILCPISKQVNAYFAFDQNRDGKTDLTTPDPVLSKLPFIQGGDVFIPAASPPDGTTVFGLLSRGAGPLRTVRIPNWDSTSDRVTVQLDDFEKPVAAPPAPPAPGVAVTPVATSCTPRHRFTFRLHAPVRARIVKASAYVDGRLVKRARGRNLKRLRLAPPRGKARFTVKIVTVTNLGQRTTSVRRYTPCGKTPPRTRIKPRKRRRS